MKLSTIWYKANRELTQIQGWMGSRSKKVACAFGAIYYFDAVDKSTDDLTLYELSQMKHGEDLQLALIKFNGSASPDRADIITLNDKEHWSFAQFARRARALGL